MAAEVLKDRRKGIPVFVFAVTDARSRVDPTDAASILRNQPGTKLFAVGISNNTDM